METIIWENEICWIVPLLFAIDISKITLTGSSRILGVHVESKIKNATLKSLAVIFNRFTVSNLM